MICGLLGRKLAHSYSPQIHSQLGEYEYHLFEKEPDQLSDFLCADDFTGINVTIPYKKAVIPYLDDLTDRAKKIGAVNTIVRRQDGRLIGHNTDYFGFLSMVTRSGLQVDGKKVLVLGSGGASATAAVVLKELGANVIVISRAGENHYGTLHLHPDTSIIVNTTPVGMYPNTGVSPVDLSLFPQLKGVLDVVYNPARTQLLMDAERRGLVAINGLWMLIAQAKESAEWFTGNIISDNVIGQIYNNLLCQMENLILIGMPGCGKSTIGRMLADATGRTFRDADEEIKIMAGMEIPEIFAAEGEAGFRKRETEVLSQLGIQSGLVIATGGGCVTREENYPILHQNGRIIWIQRSLEQLPTEGRPLSQSQDLALMYAQRKPYYKRFADFIVNNDNTLARTLSAIFNLEELL
ncbi:MAG: shikimate kinase [Oscillospiraceae bacterium]|nr:shikimate kinase [Oscillospiraceae bacterium]